MYKNKLKIREFSRLCGVSIRTLRYYEQKGLIHPEEVDSESGYRYYGLGQMQDMASIRKLKNIGYSLEEISSMFADGDLNPSISSMEEKIAACEKELISLQMRLQTLRNLVDTKNKLQEMEKIEIQTLPEIIVASHRETIASYEELGRVCCEIIAPEMARLGCKCPLPGYCFTIEHNEYRPTNIDIEYCEQVESIGTDSAIIQFKRLPEVPKAVCMKHYGSYDKLYDSYVELFKYLEQEGFKITGNPRANYIDGIWNQEDTDKWLTIIQVPVE